jgi:di/tricarboxylate transporter
MVALRCTTTSQARRSIDFSVLVTIGAAIGVGGAIATSGLGAAISGGLIESVAALGGGAHLALASLVLAAMVISQLATNYGAATILFPIAMSTAMGLGTSPVPFMLGLIAGAGSNFLTPITYQTNLMVLGPGRYRFTDFARLGLGLQVIVLVTATVLIPIFFPFSG